MLLKSKKRHLVNIELSFLLGIKRNMKEEEEKETND